MPPLMQVEMIYWGLLVAALPLLFKVFWYFNDAYYGISFGGKLKLPPGHMGLPLIGETLKFLWYFKFLGRPEDFIKSKNEKYGDGFGIYKSHIFGHPTIITCSASSNNFVFRSADFHGRWPSLELLGSNTIVSVEGKQHEVLRNFMVKAINIPNALRRISQLVQPRVISTLQSWAGKGTINAPLMQVEMIYWSLLVAALPLLFKAFWYFNDAYYRISNRKFGGKLKLPPGHMGLPLIGETLKFLWYFKFLGRLWSSLNSSIYDRYGDGFGIYKSHIFGHPTIITCSASSNNFVFRSADFHSRWPSLELIGSNTIISVEGKQHEVLRNFIVKAVNLPSALRRISQLVQPRIISTLQSKGWQVVVWLRSLHTDPKNFEDPLCFKPGSFQPFGGGPRICAGNMLVRLQLAIMLHHLALNYRWKLINPDAKIKYLPHPKPEDGAIMSFAKL